ncbi:MAG: hypothetical protein WBQ25_23640 [Nitrososphaeraceae archaeon]
MTEVKYSGWTNEKMSPIFLREDSKHEECTSEYERRLKMSPLFPAKRSREIENRLKNQH